MGGVYYTLCLQCSQLHLPTMWAVTWVLVAGFNMIKHPASRWVAREGGREYGWWLGGGSLGEQTHMRVGR